MPLWTLVGLQKGKATTRWPQNPAASNGQEGVWGIPNLDAAACKNGCTQCVAACLPQALTRASADAPVMLDPMKCITCQLCTEVCPTGAVTKTAELPSATLATTIQKPARHFRHALHIRHVDAGSCNGCESELQALLNPFYDLERLGIFFTPSPRKADLLLVTGPVTEAMRAPLLAAYEAMALPRWVMAMGTCATRGGIAGGGPCLRGVRDVLPVDIALPSCPPNPAAIISALQLFLKRKTESKGASHVAS